VCRICNRPKCELICRAHGCNEARHAKCFHIDPDRWRSIMDPDDDSPGLRHADDLAGSWVCPEHVVSWVYQGAPLPPTHVMLQAIQLEHARQYMWFYSRSSAATVSNLKSGVGFVKKFEAKFNLTLVPTPTNPQYSVIGNAWHIMDRASRVKVQSLSSDTAALAYLFAAAGADNPHVHPLRGRMTMCGRTRQGLAHVLGITTKKSPRLTAALVLAFQNLCLQRASAATSVGDRLAFLELGFYVVASFLGFLRPNELSKCYLYGLFLLFFVGERQRAAKVDRPYIGFLFGKPIENARGLVVVGGATKTSRKHQREPVDAAGSELVIVSKNAYGFNPGLLLSEIFKCHGVDPLILQWPPSVNKNIPLFSRRGRHGARKIRSSSGNDSFLPRVRSVLIYLKTVDKHPDLQLVDIRTVGNYSWKITGASESQARGVPEWLRNGQGRWRRNAREPCLMVRRYIQSTLRAKLSTSDYGVQWQTWDCK
jgi:hypothetical protein